MRLGEETDEGIKDREVAMTGGYANMCSVKKSQSSYASREKW